MEWKTKVLYGSESRCGTVHNRSVNRSLQRGTRPLVKIMTHGSETESSAARAAIPKASTSDWMTANTVAGSSVKQDTRAGRYDGTQNAGWALSTDETQG